MSAKERRLTSIDKVLGSQCRRCFRAIYLGDWQTVQCSEYGILRKLHSNGLIHDEFEDHGFPTITERGFDYVAQHGLELEE